MPVRVLVVRLILLRLPKDQNMGIEKLCERSSDCGDTEYGIGRATPRQSAAMP